MYSGMAPVAAILRSYLLTVRHLLTGLERFGLESLVVVADRLLLLGLGASALFFGYGLTGLSVDSLPPGSSPSASPTRWPSLNSVGSGLVLTSASGATCSYARCRLERSRSRSTSTAISTRSCSVCSRGCRNRALQRRLPYLRGREQHTLDSPPRPAPAARAVFRHRPGPAQTPRQDGSRDQHPAGHSDLGARVSSITTARNQAVRRTVPTRGGPPAMKILGIH